MEHIYGNDFKMNNTCVAFGHFDGVHKGHRAVINKLIEQEDKNLKSLLLSFEPTDFSTSNKVIYTEEEKEIILGENRPQLMISYPFSLEVGEMDAHTFIKEILVDKLGVKIVVAGECCKFGHGHRGNINTLKQYALLYGYDVVCVKNVMDNNQVISSDFIRKAIRDGRFDEANKLLGHAYKMLGEVVHGKALGRTVGMPTANLRVASNKLLPNNGVYATLSTIDEKLVQGLTNIGRRPSVDDNDYITIETFLLDFSKDIYGKKIELDIHSYIRGVKKMNNIEEVKQQVDEDIRSVRKYLNNLTYEEDVV